MYIETANSLETDSFLNVLRRFVARRASVREIRSDQGTNLVAAAKELRRALEKMDNGSIQRCVCREIKADWVQWKRNPPSASHIGGVWGAKSVLFAQFSLRYCMNMVAVLTTNPFEP